MLKTKIEIDDDLFRRAKAHAAKAYITLRSLIECGLRLVLGEYRHRGQFKLRDASVGGRGLQPPYREARWGPIRESAYEDRGG